MIVNEPQCSFCLKLKSKVKALVQSPDKKYFICDECVISAKRIIKNTIEDDGAA